NDVNLSLMTAAIVKVDKSGLLTGADRTLLALDDATFTTVFGLSTTAEIEALNEEDPDDAALLEDLSEFVDRHILTNVNFSRRINTEPQDLVNLNGDELILQEIDGATVIVLDIKSPQANNVGFTSFNILASNGVIHTVDGEIIF
ncbi:MAG: hypothetical protein EX285_08885, partial [Thaumarchaeota archaeon]|nr:hypothetical protein [Nitrososphaerota archaeon]